MATNDDIAALRKAISIKEDENNELHQQIQIETNNLKDIIDIRQKIDDLKIIIEDEQNSYQKEEKKLNKQIEKCKKKINGFEKSEVKKVMSINTVKLTALEVSLNTNVEKMLKIDTKLAEIKENAKDKIFFIQEMDKKIATLEENITNYDILSNTITNVPHFNLLLDDLESQISSTKAHLSNSHKEISNLKIELEELKTQKAILQQQVDDFELDSGVPLTSVMPNLYSLKMTEIKQLISQSQDINYRYNHATNELNEVRNKIKDDAEDFIQQKQKLNETIQKLNNELSSLSSQFDNSITNHKTQITKTKQLQQQLESKIKDMQNSILETRSKDPSISSFSEKLESVWSGHQTVLDNYHKWQERLEKDRVILEKKLKVISELNELCPSSSKVKTEPGVKEFLFLFDVVYTQNRDMEKDLRLLIKEKEDLENENQQLMANLSNM